MKVNKIKSGIDQVSIFLLGENKFGKSTLFADTIMSKFGDPECGCMLAIGGENPATMLDYVGIEQIDDYQSFFKAIKDLCNRAESYEKVKMVAIDTVDELIPMLEKAAVDEHNKLEMEKARGNAEKPRTVKTVEQIGFNKGRERAAQLLKNSITTLRKAGFGVWVIGHSAKKMMTNRNAGEEADGSYERLKSSLARGYDEALRNIMDMTLTGTIEYEDYSIRQEKSFGQSKTIRTLNSLGKRYLYFRETPYVDASCYFAMGAVPDRILFDKSDNSELFISTIEEGQKLSSAKYRKSVGKQAEEQKAELEAKAKAELEEIAKAEQEARQAQEQAENNSKSQNDSEIEKSTDKSGPAPALDEESSPSEIELEDENDSLLEIESEIEKTEEVKTYTPEEIKELQTTLNKKFKTAAKEKKKAVREKLAGKKVSECEPALLEELISELA